MGRSLVAFVLSLCTVISAQSAAAQPARPGSYPRGELIDPVVSPSDPSQRYVLYVPRGADLKTPRPILYVMDYRGRGRAAAELFQPAAERLGWIIMSSYNTASDGSGIPNAVAVKAMWTDSHDAFAVDDNRTYLAGLSGTARMATLIAGRSGARFAGVIGAAAGFPPEAPPTKAVSFLYFGTAGTADYNYWEMRGLETRLTALALPHRIAFFDGPHGWMPPELALAALSWMELRAMHAGQRAIDRAFVEERWARDVQRSHLLEQQGLEWEASRLLAAMADDYVNLRSADEIRAIAERARQLGATPVALAQARQQERARAQHDARVDRAMQVLAEAFPAEADLPTMPVARAVLDLDIAGLLRRADSADIEEARAARRLLAQLDVQTGFYLPSAALARRDDERASFYLQIALAIRTDDPYAWYLRAALEARRRNTDHALDALERAIAHGFRTVDALDHDPSFDNLRDVPAFAQAVDDLRGRLR